MTTTSEHSIDLADVVLPDPTQASVAVAGLAQATVRDAARLVASAEQRDWAAPAVPAGLPGELERRLDDLAHGRAASVVAGPGFYDWYFTLLRAAFESNRTAVLTALKSGPGTADHHTYEAAARLRLHRNSSLNLVVQSDAVTRATENYSAQFSGLYGEEVVIAPLPPESYRPADAGAQRVERLGDAIELLMNVWPEAADTLEVCTVDVALVTGPYFVGGSDLACYGTSFLGMHPSWSALCYADHLLHEAAHQTMHAYGEISPPLTNPGYVGSHSPIRPDPRPLYGTLHATVVFSWLVELSLQVLDDPPGRDAAREAELRLHRHLLGLYEGTASLDQHAAWTPAGERLRDALGQRADDLRAMVGDPNPRLYEQAPLDYERPSTIEKRRTRWPEPQSQP